MVEFSAGKLNLADGTVLAGEFVEGEAEVTTSVGKVEVAAKEIVEIKRDKSSNPTAHSPSGEPTAMEPLEDEVAVKEQSLQLPPITLGPYRLNMTLEEAKAIQGGEITCTHCYGKPDAPVLECEFHFSREGEDFVMKQTGERQTWYIFRTIAVPKDMPIEERKLQVETQYSDLGDPRYNQYGNAYWDVAGGKMSASAGKMESSLAIGWRNDKINSLYQDKMDIECAKYKERTAPRPKLPL